MGGPQAHHRLLPITLTLILTLLVLSLPIPAQSDQPFTADLTTQHPLTLTGETTTTANQASIHTAWDPPNDPTLDLYAEHLTVTLHYEEGVRAGNTSTLEYRQITDTGTQRETFTNATLTLHAWNPDASFLAQPQGDHPTPATGEAIGTTQLAPIAEGTTLARSGYSEETAGTGNPAPGYEQDATQPLTGHQTLDEATLTGDLALYAHNTQISIQTPERSWNDWTGYRDEEPDQATAPYRLHVATLRAVNATFTLQHTQNVDLIAPTLQTQHEGSLETPQASGTLNIDRDTHTLQYDPLNIDGDGLLQTTTHEQDNPLLDTAIQGDYAILNQLPPPKTSTTQTSAWSQPTPLLPLLLVPIGAALLYAASKPQALRYLPTPAKEKIYQRWFSKAQGHEGRNEWDEATRAYDRLTHLAPHHPRPWHGKTLAQLEQDQPEAALDTIEHAQLALPHPDLDLLEFEVIAAWETDQPAQAKDALLALAQNAPRMAQGLLHDFDLPTLAQDPDIERTLGPNTGGGGIDGYA